MSAAVVVEDIFVKSAAVIGYLSPDSVENGQTYLNYLNLLNTDLNENILDNLTLAGVVEKLYPNEYTDTFQKNYGRIQSEGFGFEHNIGNNIFAFNIPISFSILKTNFDLYVGNNLLFKGELSQKQQILSFKLTDSNGSVYEITCECINYNDINWSYECFGKLGGIVDQCGHLNFIMKIIANSTYNPRPSVTNSEIKVSDIQQLIQENTISENYESNKINDSLSNLRIITRSSMYTSNISYWQN